MALFGVSLMDTTFVSFDQDIGAWKKGEIYELPSGVARAFIAGQQARESNAVEHLRASQASEFSKFKTEMMDLVRGIIKPNVTNPKQPPNGGGHVNFDRIADGTPAEERDTTRTFTDALRCIFIVQAAGAPPELVDWSRRRLRGYSDEFTEYRLNETTGRLEQTISRSLADGGLETITRTGTDSLSGGPTYGFTLKPDYVGSLFKIMREASVFAEDTRKIAVTQGNEVIWPLLDQFKAPTVVNGIPQPAVVGGITMAYVGETTARPSSDAAVDENRFKVVDLTGMTDFSRDYIVDNYIAMDAEVNRLFGEAVAWIRDWTYIRGDGVAKPQGYFNANAAITTGAVAGGTTRYAATKIAGEDLAAMLAHLAPMCWMKSRWIANVTTFPQIWVLKDTSGANLFQPNALIDQSMMLSIMKGSSVDEAALISKPMGLLVGRPLYLTEKVPVLGQTGDISIVDPSQYGDATRAGIEFGVSEHFYFSTDRIAYRFKYRHYGRSLWRAPYTQADNIATPASGTQVSPFVLLGYHA